jgi:hypothetical protein
VLDSIPTALRFARTMTSKGKHPLVELVTRSYREGVRWDKREGAGREK